MVSLNLILVNDWINIIIIEHCINYNQFPSFSNFLINIDINFHLSDMSSFPYLVNLLSPPNQYINIKIY